MPALPLHIHLRATVPGVRRRHRTRSTAGTLALVTLCAAALPISMTPAFALAATPALTDVQQIYKTAGAAEALRRVGVLIAQHPDDPTLRFQQGVMLAEQHRTAEATKVFQRLARDFPNMPEALNNLAVLYAEQGQIDKASATLEQAMRTRPNYGTAFDNLRSTYSRMAGRAYAKALQIDETPTAPKLSMIQELYEPPATSGPSAAPPLAMAAAPAASPVTVARAPSPAPAPAPAVVTPPATASPTAVIPHPATTVIAAAPPPATVVATHPPASTPAAVPTLPAVPTTPAPAPVTLARAPAAASAPATAASLARPISPPVKVAVATSPASVPSSPASAVKPPPPPTTAPTVAAKPPAATPVPRPTDDAQQIRSAVNEWAKAWARKDMSAYFAAYAPGFKGSDSSSATWQAARRARIVGKKRISVDLSGISVSIDNGVARVSFRQDYAADQLRFSNQKTLQLIEHNGKWLIDKEVAGT